MKDKNFCDHVNRAIRKSKEECVGGILINYNSLTT
jgi:hypothetical protein